MGQKPSALPSCPGGQIASSPSERGEPVSAPARMGIPEWTEDENRLILVGGLSEKQAQFCSRVAAYLAALRPFEVVVFLAAERFVA